MGNRNQRAREIERGDRLLLLNAKMAKRSHHSRKPTFREECAMFATVKLKRQLIFACLGMAGVLCLPEQAVPQELRLHLQ